jgi:hypothetical protein
MLLSKKFRDMANQNRMAARRVSTLTGRRALLGVAEEWERLANRWEAWAALNSGN